MEKKLTPQELAEQELANKIIPLIKEQQELYFKRGNGITLEKNEYVGERIADLESEISQLKLIKKKLKN